MSVEIELKPVSALRNQFEKSSPPLLNNQTNPKAKKSANRFEKLKRFSTSRVGALPLAAFYGLFIYYYVTFLILSPTKDIEEIVETVTVKRSRLFYLFKKSLKQYLQEPF
jgi:hypothetical protein